MDRTKIYPEDLNSPRQELSSGGLEIVVTLLVRRVIDFSCISTGGSIQLYRKEWFLNDPGQGQ